MFPIERVNPEDTQRVTDEIETTLLDTLQRSNEQATNETIVFSVREGDVLIAGIHGSTSYGWLLIKTLWVDKAHRGQGMAKALMRLAEEAASDIGCHSAWLDTSSDSARLLSGAWLH